MTSGSIQDLQEAIEQAVSQARIGQVLSLIGPPAAGRRTLLRRLQGGLSDRKFISLDLPLPELDATSVALANLEEGLAGFRLSPGPESTSNRLEGLRQALVDKPADGLVAFVYVPWLRPTVDARPTPARMAEGLEAVLTTLTAHCVTVLAAGKVWPAARCFQVQKFSGTTDWLESEFPDESESLARIMETIPASSRLELRLAYGLLATGLSEEKVLASLSARLPLETLVETMWFALLESQDQKALEAWQFLAAARTPVPVEWLDLSLGPECSSHPLVRRALTYSVDGKLVLHERLRAPALKTLLEPGGLETWKRLHQLHSSRWQEERLRRLQEADSRTASADVHYVYHAIEAGRDPKELEDRLWFQDQLCLLGRTLSKRHSRYEAAYNCFRRAREISPDDAYAWHYAGYNHAKMAHFEASTVEESYCRAVSLAPDQLWYHQRLVRWHLERGNPSQAREAWHRAMNASFPALEPDEPSLVYYRNLHWLVAERALETGTLDFAAEVLRDIPDKMFDLDANLAGCRTRLALLQLAERSCLVRPWPIAQRLGPEALFRQPELLPQRLSGGQPLTGWYAARVEDRDETRVFLLMAAPPSPATADPKFQHSEITKDVFDSLSQDELFQELEPGRYLEIGEYGDQAMVRVFRLGAETSEGQKVAQG